jgi:hypothetical protein
MPPMNARLHRNAVVRLRSIRAPLVEGQLGDRPQHLGRGPRGETGVVDQHLDVAELLHDGVGERANLGLVGQVGDESGGLQLGRPLVDAPGGGHDGDARAEVP